MRNIHTEITDIHIEYTLKLPIFILNKNSKFLRYSTSFNKYLMNDSVNKSGKRKKEVHTYVVYNWMHG